MKYLEKIKTLILCLILLAGISFVGAWTGPTSAPTGGSVPPITSGSGTQYKSGRLAINLTSFPTSLSSIYGLDVGGSILANGLAVTGGANIAGDIKSGSLVNASNSKVCADSSGNLVLCNSSIHTDVYTRTTCPTAPCSSTGTYTWTIPNSVSMFKVEVYGGGGGGGLNSKYSKGNSGESSEFTIRFGGGGTRDFNLEALGGAGGTKYTIDGDGNTTYTGSTGGASSSLYPATGMDGSITGGNGGDPFYPGYEPSSMPRNGWYSYLSNVFHYASGGGMKASGGFAKGANGGKGAGPLGGAGGNGGSGGSYFSSYGFTFNSQEKSERKIVLNFIKDLFSTKIAFAQINVDPPYNPPTPGSTYTCPYGDVDYESPAYQSTQDPVPDRVIPDSGANGSGYGGGGGGAGWHYCNGTATVNYGGGMTFTATANLSFSDNTAPVPMFSGTGGGGGGYAVKTIIVPASPANRAASISVGAGGTGATSSIYGTTYHGGNGADGAVVITY